MRKPRFSIAGLMGIVVVAAVGLAALRSPSVAWAEHALHGDLRRVRPGHRRSDLPQRRRAGVVAGLLRVRIGLPGRGGVHPERVPIPADAHVACPHRPQADARPPGRVRHGIAIAERPEGPQSLYADRSCPLGAAGRPAGRHARQDLPGQAVGSSRKDRNRGRRRPATDPGSVGCVRRSSPGRAWCWPPPPRRSDPDPMQGPGPARRSS